VNTDLKPLNSVLEKQYFKYSIYLILTSLIASIITFGISYHFENFQKCQSLSNRVSYLNDVFAREIIIGSTETLNFELKKLKNDYSLQEIDFTNGSLSKTSSCAIISGNNIVSHPVKFANKTLGNIISTQGDALIFKLSDFAFFVPLLVIVIFSFAFIMSLKRILRFHFFAPVTKMLKDAKYVDLEGNKFNYEGEIEEFDSLKNQLNSMLSRIHQVNDENIKLEKAAGIGELATQVAHDIRSPLEVLKGLREEIKTLPEDSRQRIHLSINRIEEIAFNLLKSQRQINDIQKTARAEELLSLVDSILTEKKIEFKSFPKIEFEIIHTTESYGLFSEINRTNLKSIISNLINNSIESFEQQSGRIEIRLSSENNFNVIGIKDNGVGITENLAKKLFNKGFTTKEEGNGLGLYNARKDIEVLGGIIDFESHENVGTTFFLRFPISSSPSTFVNCINLGNYSEIIILDDDFSFHEVWKKKLSTSKISIKSFYSAKSLLNEFVKLPPTTLLLCDFETMDEGLNGLDTIAKLQHSSNSILVTARNEESYIQERCLRERIKLLPKSMISFTKINLDREFIALIDDDKLIHLSWIDYFKDKGLTLKTLYSVDDFLFECEKLPKQTKIYIDSNLGQNIKGEIESEKISLLGYRNLYLSTGYQKQFIQKPEWIREIYSKSPEEIFG
jgi:signal transduction histidine kinase/FixJ family two-component response regulator